MSFNGLCTSSECCQEPYSCGFSFLPHALGQLTQPSLRAELKRVGTQLIALAQAFDAVEQDSSQLELAELKFKDLLTVSSLEVICCSNWASEQHGTQPICKALLTMDSPEVRGSQLQLEACSSRPRRLCYKV